MVSLSRYADAFVSIVSVVSARNLQLVDDVLDYDAVEDTLGKPGGADLQLGLATGPALYAWEEYPEMGPLIRRKFSNSGDVELVRVYSPYRHADL